MNTHAPNLDIDKFRKVAALMKAGATDGERSAAKARAESMAAKAGMTLAQAMSKLDKPAKTEASPFSFSDIFNDPFFKEQRNERQRKNAIKRERLLKEYGSVAAVFDPTPWEIALRKAIEPFSIIMSYACISKVQRHYTAFMDGEQCGDFLKGTPRARAAIAAAYPMPRTIGEAMEEVKIWNKLRWDRGIFHDDIYGYNEEPEVCVRTKMVEDFLATAPVQNWHDLEDRFAWKKYEFESQYLDPIQRNDPFMDRIEEDFRILREMAIAPTKSGECEQPAQNGQRRTNAEKATMVREILTAEPNLSDREISRRAGVSPQTVSNWRARMR